MLFSFKVIIRVLAAVANLMAAVLMPYGRRVAMVLANVLEQGWRVVSLPMEWLRTQLTAAANYGRAHWLGVISYAISAVGLAYVLWNLHPAVLLEQLKLSTWWLVGLAIVLDIAPRALQALRWQYLLQPAKVEYRFLLQAIYVGTLYSGILPLSTGDAVRGLMVARHNRVSASSVISSELLERVSDAMALIVVVWFTLRGLVLPQALRLVLATLEALVAAALIVGILLVVRKGSLEIRLSSWRPSSRGGRALKATTSAITTITSGYTVRGLLLAFVLAVGTVVLRVGVLWLLLMAYHLDVSFLQAAGLFAIIMIGTFLPNTPGNIGSWQFFCVLGLTLFGISSAEASAFSLIGFALWTVPPILLGAYALVVSPFSWSDLRIARRRDEQAVP